MINVNIENDDSEDNFVVVIDQNLNPPAAVPGYGGGGKRLNSKAAAPAQIQEDGAGNGNLAWTAIRCNDVTVSKNGAANPQAGDTVLVSAS